MTLQKRFPPKNCCGTEFIPFPWGTNLSPANGCGKSVNAGLGCQTSSESQESIE